MFAKFWQTLWLKRLAILSLFTFGLWVAQPIRPPLGYWFALASAATPLICAMFAHTYPSTQWRNVWLLILLATLAWLSVQTQLFTESFNTSVMIVGYASLGLALWRYPHGKTQPNNNEWRTAVDIVLTIGALASLVYNLQPASPFTSNERLFAGWLLIFWILILFINTPPLALSFSMLVTMAGLIFNFRGDSLLGNYLIGVAAVSAGTATAPHLPTAGSLQARFTLVWQRAIPAFMVFTLLLQTISKQIIAQQFEATATFWAILFTATLIVRQSVVLGENEFQRYAQLVNSATDAAFICQRNGKFLLANPAAYDLLGLATQTPIKKQHLVNYFQPMPPFESAQMLKTANSDGWQGEGSAFHNNRALTLSLVLNGLRNEAGVVYGLVGIARNVTERKHMESKLRSLNVQLLETQNHLLHLNADLEQRVSDRTEDLTHANSELAKQNAELQTLDQLKTEFVSLVSHELRAPLTNLNGGLELLLSKDDGLSLDSREAVTLMSHEARRLTHLVEAILDLSAFEAGQLPVSLVPLSLASVVNAVLEQFPNIEVAKRVCVKIPETLPKILADERGLRSSLLQLIDNAFKYAPQSPIEISAEEVESKVELRVVDHGAGIPLAQREKIFQKFHRLNPSDAQNVYGYGLGLHTTQKFLEAMQGQIRFEETTGGGATFCLTLKIQ